MKSLDKKTLEKIGESVIAFGEKRKTCVNKRHPNAVQRAIVNPPLKKWMYCPDCNYSFYTALTSEEKTEFYRRTQEPMTI